jgi:hypothetical protein
VSGQLHGPAALPPQKEPPLLTGEEAGWAPELVWTRWRGENFQPPLGTEPSNPDHPARSQSLYRLSYRTYANSMEQSPYWKANSHLASPEITRLKVHYRVHKGPPMALILSQMNSVHTFQSYFPKIPSNIILPSTSRYSEWSFPSGFPTKIFYAFLICPMRAVCPGHLVLLDMITLIIFGDAF